MECVVEHRTISSSPLLSPTTINHDHHSPTINPTDQLITRYMGDNWVHGPGDVLINASYVWLPMEFGDDAVQIEKLQNWSMTDPFAE
jgi:hypothetical protein